MVVVAVAIIAAVAVAVVAAGSAPIDSGFITVTERAARRQATGERGFVRGVRLEQLSAQPISSVLSEYSAELGLTATTGLTARHRLRR